MCGDRKSTRLNSSHLVISYAVFCLKKKTGHHLLAVANEILDMSRLETGNFGLFPEPLRLDAVVAGCAELLALRAQEAGVAVNIEVPADLPEIVADRRALMQILINLVTNAIKF